MDLKPRPNHARYIEVLRKMGPERRLLKALELSRTTCDLFRAGLREAFPELDDAAFEALYRKRIELCHNRNW